MSHNEEHKCCKDKHEHSEDKECCKDKGENKCKKNGENKSNCQKKVRCCQRRKQAMRLAINNVPLS